MGRFSWTHGTVKVKSINAKEIPFEKWNCLDSTNPSKVLATVDEFEDEATKASQWKWQCGNKCGIESRKRDARKKAEAEIIAQGLL